MRHNLLPYVVLFCGVLMASTAAIMIRYAQQAGMSSIAIAVGRLGFAALILAPVAWTQIGAELRSLGRRDLLFGIGAGFFLALHFVTWTSSLEYTSVVSSVALVTTNPLWIALASWLVLREQLRWGTIGGIVLTLSGSGLIILSGIGAEPGAQYSNPTLGNVLALLGAIMVSGYFLIGRSLRRRLSILAYIWLVYTSGAVMLLLWLLLSGAQFWGFSPLAYLLLLGLALGPQLIGHTSFNWALAHVSATFVAVAILAEPIGSAMLAWVLFDERIDRTTREGILQLAGFVLLIAGIYVAAVSERRTPEPALSENT